MKNNHRTKFIRVAIATLIFFIAYPINAKEFFNKALWIVRDHITSKRSIDEIIEFAEIEKFSNLPCNTYSAGMKIRLATAIALNFEPKLSLNGGIDGLTVIRKVINKASILMKTNGLLILEIGHDQKEKVRNILRKKKFYINKILKDYANNDRCIISTKNNTYS